MFQKEKVQEPAISVACLGAYNVVFAKLRQA